MTTLGQTLRTAWDKAYAAAMASPNKHDPVWLREEKASLLADEAAANAVALQRERDMFA